MGFLREQMGEEELRHLLEMLSVEAGACQFGMCVWSMAGVSRVVVHAWAEVLQTTARQVAAP